ncbi:MAG: NOG1 family protein [Candidatus Helarchaeota archaeon]
MSVLTAQELINFVFHRASKISLKKQPEINYIQRARRKETHRIRTVERELIGKLEIWVKSYPNFDEMAPFYYELTNVVIDGGVNRIRTILASLSGGIPTIKRLTSVALKNVKYSNRPKEMARIRLNYYGRIASIIKRYSSRLNSLIEYNKILRKLPSIDPNVPTIVVAGYPNVGKSSLVKIISTANPEIAYYPFTTKKIFVGMFNQDNLRIQIIDSPGLLDRPLNKRNEIELQSILALKYLAKMIFFIVDPSQTCGYKIEDQISLLKDLLNNFSDIPIIIIQNKLDLFNNIIDFKKVIGQDIYIFQTNLLDAKGVQPIIEYIIKEFSIE